MRISFRAFPKAVLAIALIALFSVQGSSARRMHTISKQHDAENQLDQIEMLLARARQLEGEENPFATFIDKVNGRSPELPSDQLPLIELGELGALLADAAYAECCSTPKVTDPDTLKRAIQQHVNAGMAQDADYDVDVAKVYINVVSETLMYSGTANLDLDGRSGKRKTGFLAFRGTIGSLADPNWQGNLGSYQVHQYSKSVPSGMWETYLSMHHEVVDMMLAAAGIDDDSFHHLSSALPGGFLVVGHSLGGVLATYATLDLLSAAGAERLQRGRQGLSAEELPPNFFRLLTYGQPRDFSSDYKHNVAFASSLKKIKTRFVNDGDVVTTVPFGYGVSYFVHTGKVVFLQELPLMAGFHDRETIETGAFNGIRVRASDESHVPDFVASLSADPIQYHSVTRYMRNLELVRRHMGDRRKLFVASELASSV